MQFLEYRKYFCQLIKIQFQNLSLKILRILKEIKININKQLIKQLQISCKFFILIKIQCQTHSQTIINANQKMFSMITQKSQDQIQQSLTLILIKLLKILFQFIFKQQNLTIRCSIVNNTNRSANKYNRSYYQFSVS
ncbi:hypothetical protein TTHERM_000016329 (macronuclear) [Tetrahymena thermophila SB210]|uniref:Uncharacterized protein n=1 Tax=Tetrahymena thermophila (strain SB210) TaxID=312017 RepID=W7XAG1_TETTS|nr:hypothetical protein TTHERM_000016329 [Tetrahymena thermophila SB210]EWS76380.1 hypothetical protein TTHERM_000016329 [Tetrahymena thermophila SB210]|eukprot:XP_012651164.1 hypothetical protein TTHERM_000016329 [Tetrahymena thermophila SB210]